MDTQPRPKLLSLLDPSSKVLIDALSQEGLPGEMDLAYQMASRARDLPSLYYIGKNYAHLLEPGRATTAREMTRITDLMEGPNPPTREAMEQMVADAMFASLKTEFGDSLPDEQARDHVDRMLKRGEYAAPKVDVEALRKALGLPDGVELKVLNAGDLGSLGIGGAPAVGHEGGLDLSAFDPAKRGDGGSSSH